MFRLISDSTCQGENNTSRADKNKKQDGATHKALNANSPTQKATPKSHRIRSSPRIQTTPVTHQEVQQAANTVVHHRQEDQVSQKKVCKESDYFCYVPSCLGWRSMLTLWLDPWSC